MASPPFWICHCRLVPYQPPASLAYREARKPVTIERDCAMSGMAESHRIDSEQNTSPIIEAMSHPDGLLSSWNQMERRTICSPLSVITPMSGRAISAGMNSRMLTMLTTENTSAMRVSGRRQWLLVNRKAQAASGADALSVKTNANAAT